MHDVQQALAAIEAMGIPVVVECHAPIFNMADSQRLALNLTGIRCKNLLLRDRKGRRYLLVTTASKSIGLAQLGKTLEVGRLSLAPPDDLLAVLGVIPGALSPLALINDEDEAVSLLLHADIKAAEHYVFHPLDNAMSVQMTPGGLATFLSNTGHPMTWVPVAARSETQ